MEAFRYESGTLLCEQVPAESLAERFGTPAYVYSQAALTQNFHGIRNSLGSIPSLVYYSIKANSNLRILSLLHQAGAGFDVVSGGELARALRVGAPGERMVFSGVGKTQEEIDAGLAAGILMFNVESAGELDLIEARAQTMRRQAPISIRINPDVVANTHPYISTGQIVHKFGVPKDEALELYRRAAASPHLRVHGVACHIGSQILEIDPFLKALEEILEVAEKLRVLNTPVEFLDLGGGFGINYNQEQPLDMKCLMQKIGDRLRGTSYRLVIEPGRALVGDAGVLLTRVLYVKHNPQKSFVVVDAGMNDLMRPTLYGSHHEILPAREKAVAQLQADVVGPLCETGDFLAQDRTMPDVQPGDLLAVLTVGAYGFVLSSNYNTRPRPAEVLVNGSQAELIRTRERLEDLMAGETA